jgi:hypothetical protein
MVLFNFGGTVLVAGLRTLPVGLIAIVIVVICGNVYISAQLPLKRHRSNARSPILSNLGTVLAGLGAFILLSSTIDIYTLAVSVRAYSAQDMFRKISHTRINVYSRLSRPYWDLNRCVSYSFFTCIILTTCRWIAIRMDSLGGIFAGIVAAYLVYGGGFTAGTVGFTLTLISSFSGVLVAWIRLLNEAEVQANRWFQSFMSRTSTD